MSGVPQGSVLGPLLFLIFVDDIEENLASNCLKFADDTKLFNKVIDTRDNRKIQQDIDNLSMWGQEWAMTFNVEKCKVLHIGRKNPCLGYTLNGKNIMEVDKEKDLGILVDSKLKFSEQCAAAARKGNQMLGIIKRNFTFMDKGIFLRLYKGIVRPHLEYAIQAWNPFTRKDIDLLENIQRRATKLVKDCKELSYYNRLNYLGLTTLETRRLRGDMIETYKIITGRENLDREMFFTADNSSRTRGHSYKLKKPNCRLNIRKYSFGHRVVDEWNRLPTEVINSKNIDQFKANIDEFYKGIGKV